MKCEISSFNPCAAQAHEELIERISLIEHAVLGQTTKRELQQSQLVAAIAWFLN
jgi:hypothetical protein